MTKGTAPQRIVSINLCTDELLLRLVDPVRVAAVTQHSRNPEISTVAGEVKDLPKVQGSVEEVLACRPDLVIGGTFTLRETLRYFRGTEVPVEVFGLPKTFEDIYADIRRLARAVGETEKGEAIIRSMQAELANLKPKTTPGVVLRRHPVSSWVKKAVFFQSGGYVPGAGTFENAIMESAGLENLAATAGIRDYGHLPLEKLVLMRPDMLIFSSDQKQKPTIRGEVLSHPVIRKALPAIRTVTIPSSVLNCGSPASVEAVRILANEVQGL